MDTAPNGAHRHRLSEELHRLAGLCEGDTVTLRGLTDTMGARGHALVALMLGLPFLLPIPLPGLSVFFGICIAIAGTRMALGLGVWFPKRWIDRPLSPKLLHRVFRAGGRLMRRLERWIRPRGAFFHAYPWVRPVTGFMIAGCGLFLALPFPPGTNFPPGIAILLLSTGSLEEDGIFLALGYLAFLFNVAFFTLLPILGFKGVTALLGISRGTR